ncbi:hypothetical protein SLS64_005886 [Diaporthe eres]
MADPLSIIGTTIAVWTQVTAIYEKIKDIKNPPRSFQESGTKLTIVNQCLEQVKNQLNERPVHSDDQKAIIHAIEDCQDKGKTLKTLFQQIDAHEKDDNGWAALKNLYKATVLSLGKGSKGRVESLMQQVLETLNILVSREVLQQSTTFRDLQTRLQAAIQELGAAAQAEPTLLETDLTDGSSYVNIGGNAEGPISGVHYGDNKRGGNHHSGSGSINVDGKNHACLYVYFDSHMEDDQTLPNLLSTLLVQLLKQSQSVPDVVLAAYHDYQKSGVKPPIKAYVNMLQSQMAHRSPSTVYFVVDALDQCQDSVLAGFMDACQRLPPNVQMLCTSISKEGSKELRFDEDMRIEARDDDVKAFFEQALKGERFAQMMKDGAASDAQFKGRVLDTLVENEFARLLNHLSETPDVFYQEAVKRIKGQSEPMQLLAKEVLSWLVFADRALTLEELACGIRVNQPGRSSLDEFQSQVSKACFGIVIVEEKTKIVRLQHMSARTYLLKEDTEILKPERYAHSMIAHACLRYICCVTPEADQKGPVSLRALKNRCEHYPFLDYAANHWGRHISYGVNHDTNIEAWEFLDDSTFLTHAVQIMENFAFRVEAHVTGMHVAAYFGLSALVLKAIRHGRRVDKDARTRSEESVVHWAVRWHQHEFLEILIFSLRADAGAKDSKKRTPLHIAVANEDLRSVEVLLKCRPDERPDLEVSDDGGWTVLRYAAAHGSRVMVEKLVAEGAQVNNADDNGWTALRWAADRDYVRICEILIHRKASMELELPKPERWSLWHWAASLGRDKLVRLLIESRVNLSLPDERLGWAPLRCAVEHARTMTAWHLLEASVPTQQQDKVGRTPLHAAAEKGYLKLLWLLLLKQADPNITDKFGRTPLHLAAEKGRASGISLLLENGAKLFETDSDQRTALHLAVQEDHKEVVELLLWRVLWTTNGTRKFVQMADSEKRTALHYAAARGNLDVAKILVRLFRRWVVIDARVTIALVAIDLFLQSVIQYHGKDTLTDHHNAIVGVARNFDTGSWFNTGEVYTGKIYFGEVEDPLGNMISNIMGTCVLPYEEKGMSATTMLANIQVQTTFNITHKAIDTIMHDLTTNLAPRMSDLLSPSRNISETFGRAARLMSYHMRETADAGSVAKGETRQWVTYIRVRWAYMSFPIALAAAVAVFAAGVTTQSWRLGLNDVKGDAVSAMLLVDGHTRDVLRVEPRGARRDVVVLKTPLRLARDEKGLCLKSRMAALPTGSAGKSTHGAAAVGQV